MISHKNILKKNDQIGEFEKCLESLMIIANDWDMEPIFEGHVVQKETAMKLMTTKLVFELIFTIKF